MLRRRDQPHKVLHLTTYQRLEQYLGAFAQGHFHLLILVGAGGLAKSRSVRAVLDGAMQIAAPAFVSTLSICIVFVPVLLLTGAARYLFTPLAGAVVFAMMAS